MRGGWARAVICLLVFLALQCAALAAAGQFSLLYTAVSLRYDAPTGQTREYDAGEIYATLWRQDRADATAGLTGRQAQGAAAIGFCGNANACFGAEYITGTAPGAQGEYCAVSQALARQLWGSDDVIGQKLDFRLYNKDGELSRTVAGVFYGADAILLYSAAENEEFYAAELQNLPRDTPKAAAINYAQSAGFGAPQGIIYGGQLAALVRLAAWLPPVVVLALLAAHLAAGLLRRYKINGGITLFMLALALALLLPYLLAALPGYLVPNRLSNFSFWPGLACAAAKIMEEWSAAFYLKDIRAKALLGRLLILQAGQWLCLVLCCKKGYYK